MRFLDPSELLPSGGAWGHRTYSAMLKRQAEEFLLIFVHLKVFLLIFVDLCGIFVDFVDFCWVLLGFVVFKAKLKPSQTLKAFDEVCAFDLQMVMV